MTLLNISNGDTRPFCDLTVQFGLIANNVISYRVPGTKADSFVCEFSWNKNFNVWVSINNTVVTPTPGTITQLNSVEKNPNVRFVNGSDILRFKSDNDVSDSGFSLYTIYNNKYFSQSSSQDDRFKLLNGDDFLLLNGGLFLLLGD